MANQSTRVIIPANCIKAYNFSASPEPKIVKKGLQTI